MSTTANTQEQEIYRDIRNNVFSAWQRARLGKPGEHWDTYSDYECTITFKKVDDKLNAYETTITDKDGTATVKSFGQCFEVLHPVEMLIAARQRAYAAQQ